MDVCVLSRGSPNDTFFYPLFEKCLSYIPENSQVYYIWANPLDRLRGMLETLNFKSPNVFLFIPDDLTDRCFIPGKSTKSYISNILSDILTKHTETNFVLITDIVNLTAELKEFKNIKLINSDFLALHEDQYKKVPQINKNLNATTPYVVLAGSGKRSRIALISYLYGKNLNTYGSINIGKGFANSLTQYQHFLDCVNWCFLPKHEYTIKPLFVGGFEEFRSAHCNSQGFGIEEIYKTYENLTQELRPYYENSFVEIVCETYFEEPSFIVSEKTLHNIYGQCFPLFVNSIGIVDYLEQLGIDVFRDVVNHRYDRIKHPIDRIISLVDDNYRLLSDSNYAKNMWLNCQDRFQNNITFVQNHLHDQIRQRVLNQF